MFFDRRGIVRRDLLGRRTTLCTHPLRRALFYLWCLPPLLADPLLAMTARVTGGADQQQRAIIQVIGVGGLLLLLHVAWCRLRGMKFIAVWCGAIAVYLWYEVQHGQSQELAVALLRFTPRLNDHGLHMTLRSLGVASTTLCMVHLVYWVWTKLVPHRLPARFDSVLGHRVRVVPGNNETVAIVVYYGDHVYEEIRGADLQANGGFIPIRNKWLGAELPNRLQQNRISTSNGSVGGLPEGSVVGILGNQVGVLCWLDDRKWRLTDSTNDKLPGSLLHECLKGFRLVQRPLRYKTTQINVGARLGVKDSEGNLVQSLVPVCILDGDGDGSRIYLKKPACEGAQMLTLSALQIGGFRLEPMGEPPWSTKEWGILSSFLEVFGDVDFVLDGLPAGREIGGVKKQLIEFVRLSTAKVRILLPREEKQLYSWARWIAEPPGEFAIAYLQWATTESASMPNEMSLDPLAGHVLVPMATGLLRLIDLEDKLLLFPDSNPIQMRTFYPAVLPIPTKGDLPEFIEKAKSLRELAQAILGSKKGTEALHTSDAHSGHKPVAAHPTAGANKGRTDS